MIAEALDKGKSFSKITNYLYEGRLEERKDKKTELILHSENLRVPTDANDKKGIERLKSDFLSQAEQHINFKKGSEYVGHHTISFSKDDMKQLSKKDVENVVSDYAKDSGLDKTQFIAVAHNDTNNYHIHIVFNRVMNDGTLYKDWQEKNRTIQRGVALNLKYGLTIIPEQKVIAESKEVMQIRAGHEDIKNILMQEKILNNVQNLHHLKKVAESNNIKVVDEKDKILINDKEYRKIDLQAIFYENRLKAKGVDKKDDLSKNKWGIKTNKEKPYAHDYKIHKLNLKNENYKQVVTELTQQVKEAISNAKNYKDFTEELKQKSVFVSLTQKDDKIVGFTFDKEDYKIKGMLLDKSFSYNSVLRTIDNNQYQEVLQKIQQGEGYEKESLSNNVKVKLELRESIIEQLNYSKSLQEFQDRLIVLGITSNVITKENKSIGMTFEKDGMKSGGVSLDKSLSINSINRKLDNNQYREILEKIEKGTKIDTSKLPENIQIKIELREKVLECLNEKGYQNFQDRLMKEGITPKLEEKEGKLVGITFTKGDLTFKGTDLDEKFKLRNILNELNPEKSKERGNEMSDEESKSITNSVLDELSRLNTSGNKKKGKSRGRGISR